jgi:CRP-like cAMP-binding protein
MKQVICGRGLSRSFVTQSIHQQGDPGDKFYIIVSGQVQCDKVADGQARTSACLIVGDLCAAQPVVVNKLGPSGYFGEIGESIRVC